MIPIVDAPRELILSAYSSLVQVDEVFVLVIGPIHVDDGTVGIEGGSLHLNECPSHGGIDYVCWLSHGDSLSPLSLIEEEQIDHLKADDTDKSGLGDHKGS